MDLAGHLSSTPSANPDAWTGGYVADGFEPVAHAFQASILSGEALGAACAILHRGEIVVDLYGGWRDRSRTQAWGGDDIALVGFLAEHNPAH